ncbi:MAG: hypothetical protein ACRCXT_02475 [Paraclostridium sp.]
MNAQKNLEQYTKYRGISRKLNGKILKYIHTTEKPRNDLSLIKIIRNNEVYLDSEVEQDYIYDFIIYEKTINNQSGLDMYLQNHEVVDSDEIKLIDAMKNAKSVLYKVIEVNGENLTITLENIETNEMIDIVDIGFSGTLNKNCLVFTRIISLDDISFTSGMSMIFNINHEDFIKRILKKELKKSDLDTDIQRFISYFYLARKNGYNISMVQTTK